MNENAVLSGSLAFLALGDVIQLLGSSASTGVLRLINRYAPDPGFIYFVDGNPINARNGEIEGLDALYSLFGWVSGSFEFTREPILTDKRITKSRMGIILEGTKLLDDGQVKKVGPASALDRMEGLKGALDGTTIVKGPLVDYMYVVDEEDYFDGEQIVEEGKHGSWMWVILEGVVDIVKVVDGVRIPIIRVGSGGFIGSIASFLLQGHIRTATAVAVGNVQLGVLDSQRLAQEYAGLSLDFRTLLASMDRRQKQLTARIIDHHLGNLERATYLKDEKRLVGPEKSEPGQFYLIQQGRLSVAQPTDKGPVVHYQLFKGDFFGELPFLHLADEGEKTTIFVSENFAIAKVQAILFQKEYQRLSVTFRNIIDNMATCLSVNKEMVSALLTSTRTAPAEGIASEGRLTGPGRSWTP